MKFITRYLCEFKDNHLITTSLCIPSLPITFWYIFIVNVLNVCLIFSLLLFVNFLSLASGINAKTIGAVDINDLANKVYRHNFPDTNLMQRSIEVSPPYSYLGLMQSESEKNKRVNTSLELKKCHRFSAYGPHFIIFIFSLFWYKPKC